jgi:dCTP deaminase
MLSNEDIKSLIDRGELVVEPYHPEILRGSGLMLHLGHEILRPIPGTVVDVKNRIAPDYETHTITRDDPYPLHPGEFVLAHTYQKVSVGPKVGFLIEGRSTLARVGLTIVQTAMIVYPGHRNRTVTLELANHGANTILLYHQMKIARVALFELKTPTTEIYDTSGKYREQVGVGRPIFVNELLGDE